jgi:hypothetical protein
LAYRIASYPADALARAKSSVSFEGSVEDALNQEEVHFLKAAHSPAATQRMAAALAIGLQTPAGEKGALAGLWAALAHV